MEAPEVPLEQVHEDIHHHTSGHHQAHAESPWTRYVALSTAFLAALAALAALCAGHTETEAMHAKMDANDQWAFYQAKSIKANQLENTSQILAALGKEADPALGAKLKKYEEEKVEIQGEAKAFDHESSAYLGAHSWYGYGVTMFQVAIALSAISALTRRRRYWLISLGIGAIGVGFAASGVWQQSRIHEPETEAATAAPAAHHSG
jgi:hypothetical protein